MEQAQARTHGYTFEVVMVGGIRGSLRDLGHDATACESGCG